MKLVLEYLVNILPKDHLIFLLIKHGIFAFIGFFLARYIFQREIKFAEKKDEKLMNSLKEEINSLQRHNQCLRDINRDNQIRIKNIEFEREKRKL